MNEVLNWALEHPFVVVGVIVLALAIVGLYQLAKARREEWDEE